MQITPLSQTNFNGCIPVRSFMFNPETRRISPVIERKQIRQCQNIIVSNLNGTKRGETAEDFVDFYKKTDRDYFSCPYVKSFYERKSPNIYLITGNDSLRADCMAKPLGVAKADSIERYGNTGSARVKEESKTFYKNMENLVHKGSKRVRTSDGRNLNLNVYFEPKYKKTGEIKGFKYIGANFSDDFNNIVVKTNNGSKYNN